MGGKHKQELSLKQGESMWKCQASGLPDFWFLAIFNWVSLPILRHQAFQVKGPSIPHLRYCLKKRSLSGLFICLELTKLEFNLARF